MASELTLEQAVSKVASQNRQVLQARAAVVARQAAVKVAETRRWPVVSTQVQVGALLNRAQVAIPQQATVTIPRSVSGYSASQAALPLLGQVRIGLGIKSAKLEATAAEATAETTVQRAVNQVRSLYFQIVALEASRATLEAQTRAAREILRLAKKGVSEGVALGVEAAEAEARLARAEADRTQLEADIANAQEQLNLWLGEPLEARYALTSTLPTVATASADEAVAAALRNRPEIREARLKLAQAGVAIESKKWEWVPDVDLAITQYGFLNTGGILPRQAWLAGLNFKWEPLDWGRKRQESVGLVQQQRQAQLSLKQLEQEAAAEARRSWREWERAQRDLNVARQQKAATGETLRIAQQRYENQVALLRSVLEAQTAWEEAGQREARAMAASGTAWANLQLAMGVE
jgi:cobalt-zinc-cadmium efflux system outer membrane protein